MTSLDFEELVSKAENEGVTLAEIISRTLTPRQIDEMQGDLAEKLADNYGRIEGYMRDVKVPSLEELMNAEEFVDNGSAARGNVLA